MQVIGLCRFSYPAEGGFQVEHDSLQDRVNFLYAPHRMEERFRHFECIALPGIKAQTDPDFTFLILIGDTLPADYLDRLRFLTADIPQIRIVSRPPMPHRRACQDVINETRGGTSSACLQFRHDDDDAVGLTYIERFRQAARDTDKLRQDNPLVAIDFNRGYHTQLGPDGIHAEETFTPYWGVALGMAVQAGNPLSIMNFAHNKMNRFMPTVTFSDTPMYIRGHNDFNDSRMKMVNQGKPMPLLDADAEARFRAWFAVDANKVRQVFV